MDKLTTRFLRTIERCKDRVGLSYKQGQAYQDITWGEVGRMVTHFAHGLQELGFKKGERLAILEKNSPFWLISDFATQFLGGVNVPIYNSSTPEQIRYILNHSGSAYIVVADQFQYQKVQAVYDSLKPQPVVIMVRDSGEGDKVYTFQQVLDKGKEKGGQALKELDAQRDVDDMVSVVYTSGTTGNPKGVMLSHKNFGANIDSFYDLFDFNETDTILSFLPLSHVLERLASHFYQVQVGSKIAYAESIEQVAENLLEVKPTVVISVPRLYEQILRKVHNAVKKQPAIKQKIFQLTTRAAIKAVRLKMADRNIPFFTRLLDNIGQKLVFQSLRDKTGGRMRFFISGGAPISVDCIEFFFAARMPIYEGYGLTETAPVLAVNCPGNVRFGTVGKPLTSVSIKIADDGEILAKGENVMQGYYKEESATREAIDADGWFHTGDIGNLDAQNYLKITDRKKNIIVMSNGKNVAPSAIEKAIGKCSLVVQNIVLGDNEKYLVALAVVDVDNLKALADGMGIPGTMAQLLQDPRIVDAVKKAVDKQTKEFASFERVRRIALLERPWTEESGELTPTKKPKRRVIMANNQATIDRLFNRT